MNRSSHYKVLAHCTEEQVCRLALEVSEQYPASQVKILSGPQVGLVMLRMEETVANSQFNAGEILVTEVRLELDNQFGFAMLTGDRPRQAMAVALIDAALRKGGALAQRLHSEIAELGYQLELQRQHLDQLVASTKVAFETF
jgi:alpha-D-ribose 1-methylphosphonate 5-triphosphate synthase subunit PhnG